MPATSKSLNDEGVVIDNFLLVRDGRFREDEILRLLGQGDYPARLPHQNVADLRAQVAANVRGGQALSLLVEEHGLVTVQKYMRFIQENSALAVRKALAKLSGGSFQCTMDDGAAICVDIQIDQHEGTAVIDFTRSAKQQNNNMNAPSAITKAAVMYVLRTLIEEEIPLNDGFLSPVSIKLAPGSLLNPSPPAAIVAGNVETSQQITDALYGALNAMAASQGTMNNFTFGTERYQYYETIAGGSGAGADFDGTSAVQTNMTNSRLTDPEVLELRFPVLLESFCIRKGSGGAGKFRGGDGVIRRLKFLEPMTASILSQRRLVPPFGLAGGQPGACGNNSLIRANGDKIQLSFTDTVEVNPGDTIIIETPGGGGFGAPDRKGSI
jgi:N-methylhydantoinase B/oxoprolinase/acetone carboxylase alpha subunit